LNEFPELPDEGELSDQREHMMGYFCSNRECECHVKVPDDLEVLDTVDKMLDLNGNYTTKHHHRQRFVDPNPYSSLPEIWLCLRCAGAIDVFLYAGYPIRSERRW